MAFLKVLLSCNLIFAVTALFSKHLTTLYTHISPLHYNIKFVPYDNDIFYGECNVSIYIGKEKRNINFYTENLSITEIVVTNSTQSSNENKTEIITHTPTKFLYNNENYITDIAFMYKLSSGVYSLNMKFIGLLADDGGFRTYYVNQENRVWLAATQFHTFATRRLFPFWKNNLYASFNISVKHVYGYIPLSNMPVQAINVVENNMRWTHFETIPPMPAYYVSVAISNFDLISERNQRAILWGRPDILPHLQFAYTIIRDIMLYLEKNCPRTRKTANVNHIAVPNLHEDTIHFFGFILHRETDITFDQKIDPQRSKIKITRLIGHKMVHEWFNNMINPFRNQWLSWLSEGFVTFFGIYIADKIYPDFQIQNLFMVQTQFDVLHLSTKDTWPFALEAEFFEIPLYIKTSIMLQNTLTEEIFQNGFQIYLQNLYINDAQFWNVIQVALNNSNLQIKYNVLDRTASWAHLKHYPVINVTRNYNDRLNISVENFDKKMWIRVVIIMHKSLLTDISLHTVWLELPKFPYHTLTIDLDNENKDEFVLVNSQQTGCYRVYYDVENWFRLMIYLNSKKFMNIHVLDRAKIIDDAFHFTMTGQLHSSIVMGIFYHLWQDTNYIAWYPMFKNLEYMSTFFAFPKSKYIKEDIAEVLKDIFKQIKYPDFKSVNERKFFNDIILTKCLREEAARWLCIIDKSSNDNYCLYTARDLLEWYLSMRNVSSSHKIWAGWKEWTFCNGLMLASNYTWMNVFHMYENEADNNLLRFLACSKDPFIIRNYIYLMGLNAYLEKVTDIDHIISFYFIIARHANNTSILNFILDNLERIKPEKIRVITALNIIINHVYSKDHINKIQKYVENNFIGNPVSPDINFGIYCENELGYEVRKFLRFKAINMKRLLMYLKLKLELREAQITTQLNQFRYFIRS